MKPELIHDPRCAADMLRRGRLVAFPTETVYGLGVDATNAEAVRRLYHVKGRPSNNPLIVHVADIDELHLASTQIPAVAIDLLQRFAPGPITVVVPKHPSIVAEATASLATVGVRIPNEDHARQMLKATRRPIAAPSANRSGRPSSTTYQSVLEDFGDSIDGILVGEPAQIGLESTVVDCTRRVPHILRPGGVTLEQLKQFYPDATMAGQDIEPGENSPGRLHPHYRPAARVQLFVHPGEVPCDSAAAYLALKPHPQQAEFGWSCVYQDVDHYARSFYEALRESDRRGLTTIYCQRVLKAGTGIALSDRMERAAEA